ncbi:hypothetical protein DPV78_007392 [Talaromyces pinophilus]|nr:hypothetical protein DPV78_007392 [Talaromyces pinophilus]
MYWPTSRNERWFCWTVFVQAVAVLVLEIYIFSQWESWIRPNGSQVAVSYLVPINLSLIMFAVVYESLLSLKLMHDKSNILLVAICVSKACIFAYSIMQYSSMHESTVTIPTNRDMFNQPLVDLSRDLWKELRPAEMMVPIIVGASTVIVCPIAYQLHKEYSWAIYQCVRGDPKTRFRYRGYEVYLVLITFDIYFLVGFIIQYNLVDVHFVEPEFSLTMALIPAVVMITVLSVHFIRHENRIGTVIILISYVGVLAYIISRIIVLCGHGLLANTPGKDMMLLFAFVALIFTFLATACAVYCLLNFERGLKSVFERKSQIPPQSFAFQEISTRYNSARESSKISLEI